MTLCMLCVMIGEGCEGSLQGIFVRAAPRICLPGLRSGRGQDDWPDGRFPRRIFLRKQVGIEATAGAASPYIHVRWRLKRPSVAVFPWGIGCFLRKITPRSQPVRPAALPPPGAYTIAGHGWCMVCMSWGVNIFEFIGKSDFGFVGRRGLCRKNVFLYPFLDLKHALFGLLWGKRGSMQNNCIFVPLLYVENGGTKERFFCIDPWIEKRDRFFRIM